MRGSGAVGVSVHLGASRLSSLLDYAWRVYDDGQVLRVRLLRRS